MGERDFMEAIDTSKENYWRGDGVAERAGLENRRWGNLSASSNLAPSAIYQQLMRAHIRYLARANHEL